jgi:hypothetical protein
VFFFREIDELAPADAISVHRSQGTDHGEEKGGTGSDDRPETALQSADQEACEISA